MNYIKILIGLLLLAVVSCQPDSKILKETTKSTAPIVKLKVPAFNRDSAFAYVEKQVNFGSRRPNTDAHRACAKWMEDKLRGFNLATKVQNFEATTTFGEKMQGYNIIAQYKPELKKRVMLSAHWDSRYMAEKDADPSKRDKEILGADDGASGTGVLIEIARILSKQNIPLGVDFVLFDLEDQGDNGNGDPKSWCLGSQYWAKNPHIRKFKFGINLDMVGAKGAVFKKEGYSMRIAPGIVNKYWQWGKRLGYGNYFSDATVGGITDDHVFVNESGVGPMINVIYTTREYGGTFGAHHHTHNDNMDIIDRNVLKAVGQVTTAVIFKEAEGSL